ncbi:hypothetical protein KY335_03155 [Candidatus Woesearchaeota archaeon]|nr:hypothetical protein [Candidatus Woesearchaeota archaeon]MBW3014216.1 hypothetical protein [Candidatus Woesearchaeota archaeon]
MAKLPKQKHEPHKPRGRGRKARPKTFKTEAAAKAYAEAQGLKSYKIVNLKSELSKQKKLQVISE